MEISDIRLEKIALPYAVMTVNCGKGAYIHTLCHDIDERLGCGGVMETLLRTRVGPFQLGDAYALSELEVAMQADEIEDKPVSVKDCLALCPARKALLEADTKLGNDNTVTETVIGNGVDENGTLVRLYLNDGSFVGLSRKEGRRYWAEKIFLERGDA